MLKPPKANFLLLELIRRSNKLFRSESVVNDKKELALKSKTETYDARVKGLSGQLNLKKKKLAACKEYFNGKELNNFIKAQELEKNKKIEKIKNKISDIKKEYAEIKTQLKKSESNKKLEEKKIKELEKKIKIYEKENLNLKDKLKEKSEEAKEQERLIKEKNKETEKKKLDPKKMVEGEDELSIVLERLYKTSDQMTKQHLELNELTEATKIFTIIMGKTKDKAIKQMRKGDVFVNNNAANLVEFGKYANSNYIKNKEKIAQMTIENGQLENDLDSDCQELNALEEKDKSNAGAAGGASFYVSFSDIISVLLCFFILFFAMGKVDGAKAAKLASTFTEKVTQKKPVYNAYVSEEEFTMMEKVKELVLDNVKPEDIIGSKTKTVSHIISGSDLFYPGETVLSEEGKNLLKSKFKKEKVGTVKELIIEGHTDDKEFFEFPEISKKFENNTELSAARAISVVEIIEKILHLSGEIVGIRAYGSNRPLKPNTTDLNRALNRRVVIQIITEVTKKKVFTNNETSKPKNEQKNNQNLKNTKTT